MFDDSTDSDKPVSFNDYNTWLAIISFIFLLVITMLVVVKVETFIKLINDKYFNMKDQPVR